MRKYKQKCECKYNVKERISKRMVQSIFKKVAKNGRQRGCLLFSCYCNCTILFNKPSVNKNYFDIFRDLSTESIKVIFI